MILCVITLFLVGPLVAFIETQSEFIINALSLITVLSMVFYLIVEKSSEETLLLFCIILLSFNIFHVQLQNTSNFTIMSRAVLQLLPLIYFYAILFQQQVKYPVLALYFFTILFYMAQLSRVQDFSSLFSYIFCITTAFLTKPYSLLQVLTPQVNQVFVGFLALICFISSVTDNNIPMVMLFVVFGLLKSNKKNWILLETSKFVDKVILEKLLSARVICESGARIIAGHFENNPKTFTAIFGATACVAAYWQAKTYDLTFVEKLYALDLGKLNDLHQQAEHLEARLKFAIEVGDPELVEVARLNYLQNQHSITKLSLRIDEGAYVGPLKEAQDIVRFTTAGIIRPVLSNKVDYTILDDLDS